MPADLPPPPPAIIWEAPHKFWDKKNIFLHGLNAAAHINDAISTQRFLELSRRSFEESDKKARLTGLPQPYVTVTESNPLARPFVTRGWKGQSIATSFSILAPIGVSAILHKTNHHKIERWIPVISFIPGAIMGSANYRFFH